jgi:5-methylcytosine-specific restriction endonuclease McrA
MKTFAKHRLLLILFQRQYGRCCYCRRFVSLTFDFQLQKRPEAATIEHLRRKADGGRDHPDNVALACKRCNDERGDADWLTYTTFRRNEFPEFVAVTCR